MSENKITTLLMIGFGAAVIAILEICSLFIDVEQVIYIGIGGIAALLLLAIFYLDDLKHKS
jgi:hypothetical protein